MNTFVFLLVCYGACNNMIYGSLFTGWRNFLEKFGTGPYSIHKLFTCPMCLGTWMGMAISFILNYFGSPTPILIGNLYMSMVLHGLLAGGGVWLLHTIQETFERAFDKS